MTTFQDPPLHSRRAVRQSETRQDDTADGDAAVRPASARTGRRAQLPSATEWRPEDSATAAISVPAASEPFVLTTQTLAQVPVVAIPAPPAPVSDEVAERPRATSGRRAFLPAGELPDMVVATDAEVPADTIEASVSGAVPTQADNVAVPVQPAEPVVEIAPFVPVHTDVVAVADTNAAAAPEIVLPPVAERTLTRRELRELRAAAERAAAQEVPEAIVSILNSGPIILPYLSTGPTSRGASDAVGATEAVDAEALQPATPVADGAAGPVSTWGVPITPGMPVESPDIDVDDDIDDEPASAGVAPLTGDVVPVVAEQESSPASARSAGHWSVRSDTDEDIESLEGSISRSVGANGALATSALVLPSVPQSSDITSPFTSSGEIMATGSFDLPRSLASTGAHPSRVDTSDFDLDPLDHDVPTTDSAPVRAIRAISTHTGSNGMVATKKQSNRTLTVLVITASTVALGVAGAIVLSVALNLFP